MTQELITAQSARTLPELFRERVKRSPETVAYRYFNKEQKLWHSITWSEMSIQVAHWQAALAQENLVSGDKVAIMLRNCPQWVMCDQAALALGLVIVPLYTDDNPENVAYILNNADVKLLLIEGLSQWKRLYTVRSDIVTTTRVVSIQSFDNQLSDSRLVFLEQWLPLKKDYPLRAEDSQPEHLASIVYTSGTTGRPKGVMLSHQNILGNAQSAASCMDFNADDLFLSFLPLSHTLERTGGYYIPMIVGVTVAYARSIPQLSMDLITLHPTFLVSVPRIYEQVYAKIHNQLDKKSALAQKLFQWTIQIGWRRFEYHQQRASWHPSFMLWPILQRLVAKPILSKLGGRMRFAITAGAPMPPMVAKLFIGLGLGLLQGYGLTETSPVICVNRPNDNIPDSLGITIPGVHVKLGEHDELLTKSPYVMLGYWNNPSATKNIIDEEGWLHTGDKVRQDEQGHLYITGRIKEIIVMGNGEKVPPANMEMAISIHRLFDQVMIIGEGKPFLSALVVLNADNWLSFAQNLKVDKDALHAKSVQQGILTCIGTHIKDFPSYAKVRRVSLSLDPWTVENGLITPTLKLKRARIIEKYETEIENMYKGY